LLDPEFEVEGCFLLPNDEARRRFSAEVFVYRSKLNGRGPWAWNRHWLVVPLVDRVGATIGVIWADEPEDRLLPPRERLEALRLLGRILVESLRRSDEAFRIGGDEFALVLPDTSPDAVRSVVARVSAAMDQAPEGALEGVRASFGAAAYPSDAGHPEALVH